VFDISEMTLRAYQVPQHLPALGYHSEDSNLNTNDLAVWPDGQLNGMNAMQLAPRHRFEPLLTEPMGAYSRERLNHCIRTISKRLRSPSDMPAFLRMSSRLCSFRR
jgi:hypothetical protein